jgi:hypothetical protein
MLSEAIDRLRDFFSTRAGMAVGALIALVLIGATALVVEGEDDPHEEVLPTSTTTTTTAPPPQTADGVLLGASTSTDGRSSNLDVERAAVEALERGIGRTLDINHNFYPWDEPFPTDIERWDLASGRIPMISWNGKDVRSKTIAAGAYDDMIRQRARATKALGEPVLIRWFWEMDGKKKVEFAGSPEQYIAAWRHIVGIFRAEGADNASWVWCPNASAFNDGEAPPFYPGDDVVDWTCADGYNWAPGRAGDDYRSFEDIFGGFYGWATLHDKPIMVGEFGVQERKAGEKAEWITAAAEAIKTHFPRMKAIVYFNANADYDWRLATSDSALAAFRQLANDPYFNLGPKGRQIL